MTFVVLSTAGQRACADDLDVLIDRLLPSAWLKEEYRVNLAIALITGESGFGNRFAPFTLYAPLPEGVVADGDIRKVLVYFDEILAKALVGSDFASAAVRQVVRKELDRSRLLSLPGAGYWVAPEPAAHTWIEKQRELLVEGYRLIVYAKLLRRLAPSKLGETEAQEGAEDMGLQIRDSLPMRLQRRAIQRLLSRPGLESVLPSYVKLDKLRAIEAELTTMENQQQWVRQRVGQFPAGWLRAMGHEFALQQHFASQAKAELATAGEQTQTLIVKRLGYLIDPRRAGYCAALDLDPVSLVASGGDWRKMRTKELAPVSLKTWMFKDVVYAYSRGCFVPKDFAIVRALYEQWAEGHGDEGGKLALQVNCRLATLYRYGVGGRRDEAKAAYWEEKTLRGTTVPCRSPDLVDPRDPMKDLH